MAMTLTADVLFIWTGSRIAGRNVADVVVERRPSRDSAPACMEVFVRGTSLRVCLSATPQLPRRTRV